LGSRATIAAWNRKGAGERVNVRDRCVQLRAAAPGARPAGSRSPGASFFVAIVVAIMIIIIMMIMMMMVAIVNTPLHCISTGGRRCGLFSRALHRCLKPLYLLATPFPLQKDEVKSCKRRLVALCLRACREVEDCSSEAIHVVHINE
jgi:hypothetical protein